MFRTLVILGMIAVFAFMAGWFTIERSERETTIRFNRDEIHSDTSRAIAKGREILNESQGPNASEQPLSDAIAPERSYPQPGLPPQFDTPQQATRPVAPWEQPAGGAVPSGTQPY
jgi:hypothetical protein